MTVRKYEIISLKSHNLPGPQMVVVQSQPALTYSYLSQLLVARPFTVDTFVVDAKPVMI